MDLRIHPVKTKSEMERVFPLMQQLRTHLNLQDFIGLTEKAQTHEGYELLAVEDSSKNLLALMGYRFIHDFVHGYHLYVDDLVVNEEARSQGIGAAVLKHAEKIAKDKGCKGLRLCTGIDNERGKKFYEKNGWNLRAVAFKKKL